MRHLKAFFTVIICLLIFGVLVMAGEKRDYQKPEDVVAWLYHDFAWEVVMSRTPSGASRFYGQTEEVLERYLSKELAALILKDQEILRVPL